MSNDPGYLLAVTADQAERRKALGVIAKRLGLELVPVDKTPAALSWLMGHDPNLVVLDARIPKAEQLALKLRGKKTLANVPVISLSEEMSDVFTASSYAAGADDVIPVNAGAQLAQRLRVLPRSSAPKLQASRGVAVVADANRGRCDLLTRVLAGAGYEVKSAIDERSLQFYQKQHGPQLFVVNSELTDVRQAVLASRRDGHSVAWVITASRRELDSLSDALHDARRVVVTGANAPPTDALFLANELCYEGQTSRRKGSRKLLGTVVRFREAGTEEEDYGFTYNVSERGMYVRTIAPPPYEEVWLELIPPKANHWVRLLGRVTWRHAFNPGIQSLSPPGFGVELLTGLGEDLASFEECFRAFADTAPRGAGRSTFVPVRRASVGIMPRAVPPPASAGELESAPSSKEAEVRDSWLSPDELESLPPPASGDDLVRDSEWDSVEGPPGKVPAATAQGAGTPATNAPQSDRNEDGAQAADEKVTPAASGDAAGDEKEGKVQLDDSPASLEAPDAKGRQRSHAEEDAEPDQDRDEGEQDEKEEEHEDEAAEREGAEAEEGDEGEDEEEPEGEARAPSGRPAVFDRTAAELATKATSKKSSSPSFLKLLLLGGATAGVTALVYNATQKENRPAATTEPSRASLQRELAVPSAATVPVPVTEPADLRAAPASSGASTASAQVEPLPTPPAEEPPFNPQSLESGQGALRVTASGQASVFVLGRAKGQVGEWITVKCGMQFVRLGRGDPPVWVSKGRSMVIPCRKTTTVEFELTEE